MYNKIISAIKENKKNILIDIIIVLFLSIISLYPLNYEVYTWGKVKNIDKIISVENEYSSKGSINLTYVRAYEGTILTTMLSKIIPSWDLVKASDVRLEGETIIDELERGKIDLETANEYAVKNALEEANIKYEEKDKKIVVYYVFKEANTNLEVADELENINGQKIMSKEDITAVLKNVNVGDEVIIEVTNNKKKSTKTAKIIEENGEKIIGLYIKEKLKIENDKNIIFKFKKSESGSSAGLMTTLSLYNKLIEEDITKGKKIAGTGTIDYNGNIGQIAGIKYKLKGAVKSGCDVFLVPSGENYEEARKLIENNKYDIKLIEVSTFKEAISKLKNI